MRLTVRKYMLCKFISSGPKTLGKSSKTIQKSRTNWAIQKTQTNWAERYLTKLKRSENLDGFQLQFNHDQTQLQPNLDKAHLKMCSVSSVSQQREQVALVLPPRSRIWSLAGSLSLIACQRFYYYLSRMHARYIALK